MSKHSISLTQKQKIILYSCSAAGAVVAAVVAVLLIVLTVKNPPEIIFSNNNSYTSMISAGSIGYTPNSGATNTQDDEISSQDSLIRGITNGTIYYTTQFVAITSDDVTSITVNGDPSNQEFFIDGNSNNMYVIEVTDGTDTTTYVVYTKPISSLLEPISHLSTNTVTSDDYDALKLVKNKLLSLETKYCTTSEINEIDSALILCDSMLDQLDSVLQRITNIKNDF